MATAAASEPRGIREQILHFFQEAHVLHLNMSCSAHICCQVSENQNAGVWLNTLYDHSKMEKALAACFISFQALLQHMTKSNSDPCMSQDN